MDPITHGIIGLGLSAFSGDPVTFSNPVSLGCAIGAMSPDIDILSKVKGNYVYLKHHRGISHSIPSLLGLAVAITWGLSFLFSDFNFLRVLIWTFVGCLSHTFFDILNSYGARLLMPFSRKKLMVGILMLYDPVITILCLSLIFTKERSTLFYTMIITAFVIYIGIRLLMKKKAKHLVKKYYENDYKIIDINILPSLMISYKWDFIIDSDSYHIVGQINLLNGKILERKKLKKPKQEVVRLFEETKMGRYFSDFTPNYHITCVQKRGGMVLESTDLRYYLKNDFMHHATIVYNNRRNSIDSFFHPYNINKNIHITEEWK